MIFKSYYHKHLFLGLLIGLGFMLSGCSKDDGGATTEQEMEPVQMNPCPTSELYIEQNGILRVDLKGPDMMNSGWGTSRAFAGFEGEDYLIWLGEDNFNTPGIGIIDINVQINTPGTYQFVWRSRIGSGTSNTEHNDSWLRIMNAADFYGEKASTGDRVYPRGSGKMPHPEGSSKEGWLKVYMNRLDEWFWRSSTNDKDPFNIFVQFDSVGLYTVQISGRSKFHALDQFVLFNNSKSLSQATEAALSEISCL